MEALGHEERGNAYLLKHRSEADGEAAWVPVRVPVSGLEGPSNQGSWILGLGLELGSGLGLGEVLSHDPTCDMGRASVRVRRTGTGTGSIADITLRCVR